MTTDTNIATAKKRKGGDEEVVPAKRIRSNYNDFLTVIVGEGDDSETFLVHKDIITAKSKFFKAATSSDRWIESQDRTVNLPDHEYFNFKIYLECLYNPVADIGAIVTEAVDDTRRKYEFITIILCETWVLGDYLVDDTFKNTFKNRVMKAILCVTPPTLSPNIIKFIAEHTTSTSKLSQWHFDEMYNF